MFLDVYLCDLRHDRPELAIHFHQLVRRSSGTLAARLQLRVRHGELVLRVAGSDVPAMSARRGRRRGKERVLVEGGRTKLDVRVTCELQHGIAPGGNLRG